MCVYFFRETGFIVRKLMLYIKQYKYDYFCLCCIFSSDLDINVLSNRRQDIYNQIKI